MPKYMFTYPEDQEKLTLPQYEDRPERYTRPFQRSTSDNPFARELPTEKLVAELSYLLSDVFLYNTPASGLFQYLYDRLRYLKVELNKRREAGYNKLLLCFVSLLWPLYVHVTLPDPDENRFQTFLSQDFGFLLDDLVSASKLDSDATCQVLCGRAAADAVYGQLYKRYANCQAGALRELIARYCAVPTASSVVAVYFVPRYYQLVAAEAGGGPRGFVCPQRRLEYGALAALRWNVENDFPQLLSQRFIVEALEAVGPWEARCVQRI